VILPFGVRWELAESRTNIWAIASQGITASAIEADEGTTMIRSVEIGILFAGCIILVLFYRGPKLTKPEAIWALGGMFGGALFWTAAVVLKLPNIYRPLEPNPLMAIVLIGGLLGWAVAKVFRFK
jgi:hypothetical protein